VGLLDMCRFLELELTARIQWEQKTYGRRGMSHVCGGVSSRYN
jgi:hypothetical protein